MLDAPQQKEVEVVPKLIRTTLHGMPTLIRRAPLRACALERRDAHVGVCLLISLKYLELSRRALYKTTALLSLVKVIHALCCGGRVASL